MKLTSSITTIVTSIEYDSEQDCYYACTSDAVPCRKWMGPAIGMVDSTAYRVYLEFGDYQNLEAGDIIRVESYYHIEGEEQDDFMFDTKGVHEVIHLIYRPSQYIAPISSDEWSDFACFIANESTHPISSYPEDGTFTRCPYSTMDRAIAAFRVYKEIAKSGTYDWSPLAAIKDVDCSDSGHYYDDYDEQYENPEPDYEPGSFEYPEDGITALEELKEELTADEEAELEQSDKFFEKLGLLD